MGTLNQIFILNLVQIQELECTRLEHDPYWLMTLNW